MKRPHANRSYKLIQTASVMEESGAEGAHLRLLSPE